MTAKRSGSNQSADNLIRAATDAHADDDEEFFAACETRWAKSFAPKGPTLRELIEMALSRSTGNGAPEQETRKRQRVRRR